MIFYSKDLFLDGNTDYGNLNEWEYTTDSLGNITLLKYLGTSVGTSSFPVCVPRVSGRSKINDYGSSGSNTPFYSNQTIQYVNLQNVPFVNNNMYGAFNYCSNLRGVYAIPNGVTSMVWALGHCTNLNQNIQIPNSVTNMSDAFNCCYNLNQNIQIPNSVTNVYGIFSNCTKLNQNILISSVVYMDAVFFGCTNLNQNIQISKGVTWARSTFGDTTKLNSTITIKAANIQYADYMFGNSPLSTKTVVFPLRYINNINTMTRNTLVSAGYAVGTTLGIVVNNTTQKAAFTAWGDIYYMGYNTYTGNGTAWILSKWNGRSGALGTSIVAPGPTMTTYNTFPTYINYPCFQTNTSITSINMNNTPFAGTTATQAFKGCTALTSVTYLNFPSGITTLASIAQGCTSLTTFSTGSSATRTVNLSLPASVTTVSDAFTNCKQISNFYINGSGITTITGIFNYCNTRALNIKFNSPNISTISYAFTGNVTSYRKNIYVYFKYKNGVATKTFNAFKAAQFMGTTGNTSFANPSYNSTSNFYIYNLGTCPI